MALFDDLYMDFSKEEFDKMSPSKIAGLAESKESTRERLRAGMLAKISEIKLHLAGHGERLRGFVKSLIREDERDGRMQGLRSDAPFRTLDLIKEDLAYKLAEFEAVFGEKAPE